MSIASVQLNDQQQQQICAAVAKAESRTSGEIVPLILASASDYEAPQIHAAACLSMATTLLTLWWDHTLALWVFAAIMAGSYVGARLAINRVSALKRLLVGQERMAETVNEKAFSLFIQQGLHYTRDATGILILICLFEKRVQILADRGINEKVTQQQWQQAIGTITAGLHRGTMVESLCEAIEQCGALLAEHCPQRADDENELPDLIIQ
ncbi:MAG: hypothetical protein C0620_09255 [Desulfuromonas sp.]|jgi:putative membrane protein|nr:MAG: hypothetical protein C0620_09255 [Desulfuromonas sp.]